MGFKRRALIPVLIYCEGLHDQVFVRRLRQLYKPDKSGYSFNIKKGDGGSPISLVGKAANISGLYQSRLIICDDDRGLSESQKAVLSATKKGVEVLFFQPCLEAVILTILKPGNDYSSRTTNECKQYLHGAYIDESKRSDMKQYGILDRTLVDKARLNNQQLDKLLKLFEKIID